MNQVSRPRTMKRVKWDTLKRPNGISHFTVLQVSRFAENANKQLTLLINQRLKSYQQTSQGFIGNRLIFQINAFRQEEAHGKRNCSDIKYSEYRNSARFVAYYMCI